jgi:tellurite resistance protein TerC
MLPWIAFTAFVLLMLALDLGVFQRRPHVIGMKEAMAWFVTWTGLALLFAVGLTVFHHRGGDAGLEFIAGFLVEKSLSIDNVFVFILIFNYFQVPPAYQHKVLSWGIVGAIVLRLLFIVGGLALLERFHWTHLLFGGFLLATGVLMMRRHDVTYDPGRNLVLRAARRWLPVSDRFEGNRFFTRGDGRLLVTPLLIVLLAVESSDIIFAVDSIPAIFAITSDPFIVYTSNIFAMLGLRALYFAVSGFMQMFHALHYGFASIITILGVKMLLSEVVAVPVELSMVLIIFILLICVIVSLLRPRPADLKLLLGRTEHLGLVPFRRLLLIENMIDLGDLQVRDAMRAWRSTKVIRLDAPWAETLAMIREARYSRYPVIAPGNPRPIGVLHLKDLVMSDAAAAGITPERVRALARPVVEIREDVPLEEALAMFQRRYEQLAIVVDARGACTGLMTIEDVLEEMVGQIGDEFDAARADQSISLAEALSPGRVLLDLRGEAMADAIRDIVVRVRRAEWPADPERILRALLLREQQMPTYLGRGLAIPHARLDGLDRPVLAFARSDEGIPLEASGERAEVFFVLLTPSGMARIQPRLLSNIVGLFESDYVTERLRKAKTPETIIEAIRAAQQVAIG